MKNIKVLGSGCNNCKTTLRLIEEAATQQGIEIQLEKVEDMQAIFSFGVMSTPGVVLDGNVVHSGGIPSAEQINSWLVADTNSGCCSGSSDSNSTGKGCC